MGRLILLILTAVSWDAWTLPDHCNDPTIKEISVPIDRLDHSKGEWVYRYQIIAGTRPNAPVLIQLPGGPGQRGISTDRNPEQKAWTVVNIDPRGAGCNKSEMDLLETFRTDQLAFDVLEVIRSENFKNYVVHGISYGTVWATVTASLAQRWNYPLPQAVILEGVLGRYFEAGDYFREFSRQWEVLKTEWGSDIIAPLLENKKPFGLTDSEWAQVVMNSVLLGPSPMSYDILKSLILPNLDSQSPMIQIIIQNHLRNLLENSAQLEEELHMKIFCRELTSEYLISDIALKQGYLIEVGEVISLCGDLRPEELYESSNWQIPVPIFYIQGERDPATSLDQALHHFNGQLQLEKHFLLVPRGGHNPLTHGLEDCADAILFEILFKNSMKDSAKSCALKPELLKEMQ